MLDNYFDVLIIGAGLSGIGAACHLKRECPGKTFAVLEGRESLGGTWDLFRYPGIRSDSDMFTLGYRFKPWNTPNAIADGASILEYINEAAEENGIKEKIRFGQRVKSIAWSSATSTWKVSVEQTQTGEIKEYNCNFIMACTGYYKYEAGYEPDFKGKKDFKGELIHPQHWPEGLDYSNKRVIVIGSGATAMTIIPAMAKDASHITMLQRSPTYVMSLPQEDPAVNTLRKYLPNKVVYRLARTRNVAAAMATFKIARSFPEKTRAFLLSQAQKQLGPDFDMKHFSPNYNPWDERLCVVPNGDLFSSIRRGDASVVTDHIDYFTENGIKLKSGEELEADIIITATGLDVQMFGGMDISVDGNTFDIANKMCYRGVLFEDLPNMGMLFGYTNASWTLKTDLVSEYICRLLNHMDKKGKRQCVPVNKPASRRKRLFGKNQPASLEPVLDMQSGYIQRAQGKIPQQGTKLPWKLYQNYAFDFVSLRFGKLRDGVLRFSN